MVEPMEASCVERKGEKWTLISFAAPPVDESGALDQRHVLLRATFLELGGNSQLDRQNASGFTVNPCQLLGWII